MKKKKIGQPFLNPTYPVKTLCLALPYPDTDPETQYFHDTAEILVIQTGTACLQIGRDFFFLSAGQGLFLKPNTPHSIRPYDDNGTANGDAAIATDNNSTAIAIDNGNATSGCTIQSLHFSPTFLFGQESRVLNDKYIAPINDSPDFHCLPLNPDHPRVSEILRLARQAIMADTERQFAFELEVKSLLLQIWKLILPSVDEKPFSAKTFRTPSHDSERTGQAIRFIEGHYEESITLEDIAYSIHLSKSECCRCFRRSLGITPFEYLLKFRIDESVRKLKSGEASDCTISELASLVGFNSPSYYNKVFRKYMNCTPMEYKKNVSP